MHMDCGDNELTIKWCVFQFYFLLDKHSIIQAQNLQNPEGLIVSICGVLITLVEKASSINQISILFNF